MKRFTWIISIVIAFTAVFILGCGGGAAENSDNGNAEYGAVIGIVEDTDSGAKIAGVHVAIDGAAVAMNALGSTGSETNEQGYFTVDRLAENTETVIKLSKDGYVPTSEIVAVREGSVTQVTIYMRQAANAIALNAASGGSVSHGGATVTIAGGDLVDANGNTYSGTAKVSLTPFDPTTEAGRKAFPGDFIGVKQDGSTEPLMSYGFVDITVTDGSGNKLQLKNGAHATIQIPIPASLQATAPATMPLWWFNPDDAKWHEVGTLTNKGTVYESTIEHFSIYNSDVGYSRSFVSGHLVNCRTGQPIRCGQVKIVGISPRNCWESGESCTDSNGGFVKIPVDAGSTFKITGYAGGIASASQTLTAAPAGQTIDIGNICVNNPVARITLVWNAKPRDLDAHLTYGGSQNRKMVYYNNQNEDTVKLDTDDTDGNGPEIVSIYSFSEGIYRYSVHHYAGDKNIGTSGTRLNMVIDENGDGKTRLYSMTPTASSSFKGRGDVWSAWDIYVENGKVTKVKTLNTIDNDVNDDDVNAFSP